MLLPPLNAVLPYCPHKGGSAILEIMPTPQNMNINRSLDYRQQQQRRIAKCVLAASRERPAMPLSIQRQSVTFPPNPHFGGGITGAIRRMCANSANKLHNLQFVQNQSV